MIHPFWTKVSVEYDEVETSKNNICWTGLFVLTSIVKRQFPHSTKRGEIMNNVQQCLMDPSDGSSQYKCSVRRSNKSNY